VNENILMLKNNTCGTDEKHHYCKNNKGRIYFRKKSEGKILRGIQIEIKVKGINLELKK